MLHYLSICLAFIVLVDVRASNRSGNDRFNELIQYSFDAKASHVTDGLLVIHKGELVLEKYGNGYNRDSLHLLWSISKSVTSLLTGTLVKEGLISLDDKVSTYYPKLSEITVKNLLQMSSGISWNEGYENNPLDSNVIQMLYTSGHKDMANYTSEIKIAHPPNTSFRYSSGETNLLMGFLKNRIGDSNRYANLPWEKIFDPLAIKDAVWERDLSGTFVGSSYLYLRPLDLAKIGQVYLQGGKYNAKELISSKWVEFSRKMAPAFERTQLKGPDNNESYGAMWWLNLSSPLKNTPRPYPSAPEDLYMALGHHGQMLAIIPSLDLIIVRTAQDKSEAMNKDHFFKLLIKSLEI